MHKWTPCMLLLRSESGVVYARETGQRDLKSFTIYGILIMEKLGFCFTGKIKKDIKCFPIPTEMEF